MDFVYGVLVLVFAAAMIGFAALCARVEKTAMSLLYVVGGLASIGLFAYLLYALLRAEDF